MIMIFALLCLLGIPFAGAIIAEAADHARKQ